MANLKFPLILNGVKFKVNPTSLSISKPLVKSELPTKTGVRYQIWFDHPETLTISGISAGESAYRELLSLKRNFERTNSTNLSQLFYKTKNYRGFIDTITVTHAVGEHQRFPYTIVFQLLQGEQFNIQDFALDPRGIIGEGLGLIEQNINEPIARAERALGQVLGKII